MAKQALHVIFPQALIKEPVMFVVARDLQLLLNIRLAKITAISGEATIELEGELEKIEKAIEVFKEKGLEVESVLGDILEG